jgi:hypothetical protein
MQDSGRSPQCQLSGKSDDGSGSNSVVEDYDGMIQEGQAHNGMSALIDLVARKS